MNKFGKRMLILVGDCESIINAKNDDHADNSSNNVNNGDGDGTGGEICKGEIISIDEKEGWILLYGNDKNIYRLAFDASLAFYS